LNGVIESVEFVRDPSQKRKRSKLSGNLHFRNIQQANLAYDVLQSFGGFGIKPSSPGIQNMTIVLHVRQMTDARHFFRCCASALDTTPAMISRKARTAGARTFGV
jgi:hypothetical protein